MKIHATPLKDLVLVETTPVQDERGRFVRLFCENELAEVRQRLHFSQINLSTTFQRGSVRGMHFQYPPFAEAKLIRCVQGKVFDVAVDLRAGSSTFLKWFGVQLSADSQTQILIPEGFAHGFQALSDDAQLLYMHTASWSKDHERGLRHDDPRLGIDWPLPIAQMSARDRMAPLIEDGFTGIQL